MSGDAVDGRCLSGHPDGVGRSVWQDGRRAWQRLNGWHQEGGTPMQGAAMKALGDIRLVRGLLDQAEMGAVRAARREGRSWAEIATMLGVARQSAWERWRDVADMQQSPAIPEEEMSGVEIEAALDQVVDDLNRDRGRFVRRGSVLPVRSRTDGNRRVLAVRFDSTSEGRESSCIGFWELERRTTGGDRLSGGSFSSRLGEARQTSELWFRSGGWGGEGGWCFGGIPADSAVRRVRVATGGGGIVEDSADGGVVIVIARDGDLARATVEMFDVNDKVVASGRLSQPRASAQGRF